MSAARKKRPARKRPKKPATKSLPTPPAVIEPPRPRQIGPLDSSPLAFLTLRWTLQESQHLPELLQRIVWLGEMLKEPWQRSRLRSIALPYVAQAVGRQLASKGLPTHDQAMRAERLLTLHLDLGEPRRDISDDLPNDLPVFTVNGPRAGGDVCEVCGIAPKTDAYSLYCASPSCSFVCLSCGSREPLDAYASGLPPADGKCAACTAEEPQP